MKRKCLRLKSVAVLGKDFPSAQQNIARITGTNEQDYLLVLR